MASSRTYKLYQSATGGSAGATYVTAVQNCTIRGIQFSGYLQGAAAADSVYFAELSKNPNYAVATHDALDVLMTSIAIVEYDTAVGRTFNQFNTVIAPLAIPWEAGERIYMNTAYSGNIPAAVALTAVVYVG